MEYPVFQFNQESWDAMGFDQDNVVDDQAYAALRLSKKRNEQVEIVAATLDKAKQNDTSPNLYTRLDNRNLPENYTKEMMANALSPLLKRTLAKSPERAAFFLGDQLEKWNAAAREEEAFRQHQSYIDTLLENAEKNAGTNQSAFERQQSAEEARKRRETWKQIQEQAKINKVVNALDAYWPTDFRKETDSILDARLELLNQMGIDTLGVSREELRKTKGYQFREAVNPFGLLDAVSRGEDIVWAVDAWNGGVLSDELSHVDENSPLYVQEKMLDLLRKEWYATMPETTSEKVFNSLFKSVSFMTEMAATSGMGEMLGLVKAGGTPMLDKLLADGFRKLIQENGWKGVRQAVKEGVKRAGANAIGRIPVYAPSLALNTFGDVAPSVVTVPDDFGNPAITVKERDVTDFIQRLITNTVVQATEMFTEELGPLIPLGDLDARMLTGLLPKTARNFVAQNLIRNPATRRIAERAILDRVPFDGLIGEFGEEAIGQFMLFGATLLGQGLGFRPENTPGVTSPVMSGAEAGETLASIALQSVLFRGLQVVHAEMSGTGAVAMLRDAQRAKRERAHFDTMSDLISETRLAQSNLNEAQATVDLLLNGDTSVVVAPGEVENILLQATEGKTDAEANEARATLAQAGITQDAIDKARKDGTDVILSKNRLLALSSNKGFKNAKELVHTILDNEATEVFGKTTKELTADSFTKEQIDEMTDRAERQQTFLRDAQKIMSAAVRTAQKNAKDSGNKLGISQQNVRDFVSIYSLLANYLSKNVETEEGMKELESMVKNLSVQFAENPEKFDATAALAQVSPVWTGSAASYDQPSLQYVGTGEGNQVYGWGLYGSAARRVAEWYAKKDFQRKSRPGKLKFRGKEVVGPVGVAQAFEDVSDYRERVFRESALRRIQRYVDDAYGASLPEIVEMVKEGVAPVYDGLTRERWNSIIDDVAENLELVPGSTASRNLYKQTFWGDKEEDLLDWDEFVSANQAEKVAKGLFESLDRKDVPYSVFRLAGMPGHSPMNPLYDLTVSSDPVAEDGSQRLFLTRGKSDGHSVTISEDGTILRNAWNDELTGQPLSALVGESAAKYIMEHKNDGTYQTLVYHPTQQDVVEVLTPELASMTGGELYEQLEDILGTPKAASEFLYKAGIDGVTYIGDSSGARNYVAFSDKDIRVDEHILFQADSTSGVTRMNEEFAAAEAKGDKATAQRLVDEAAGYDPRKPHGPGGIMKVYHYGTLGNEDFTADRPIHFGTEEAAAQRISGKWVEDMIDRASVYQDEYGRWRFELEGAESDDSYNTEAEARNELSAAASSMVDSFDWDDSDRERIHSYFINTDNFLTVPDAMTQEKWDEAIADAKAKGYRGIRYRNAVEDRGSWSYIVFNPEDMKLADPFTYDDNGNLIPLSQRFDNFNSDIRYQDANTVLKGQINLARFAESQEAIITLFKDADASTLPHESAHWLKAAMESLVGAGFATDKMKEDLDTINAWLDKQDYTGAVTDQDKYRAREEYFARAFEQYLREGRFPEAASTGLKSALRRLGRMLQSIYRNALALNAPIDDSIRNFFNDIFTVEEVVDGTSLLSGILREINAGAITMSKDELANLESDIAAAKEDAESQAWLAALQAYQKGLREQRTLWRNEAKEAYADSKAEQAYAYVRAGHKLDENFLRNVLNLDEDTISILRKKRLTMRPKGTTATPAGETSPEVVAPAAPTGSATELTGDAAQFDALPDDAVVTLPADAEAAQNVLAMLTHGMDGNGGPIWKRAKTVKSATKENGLNASDITDSMKAGYDAALGLLQSGEPVTKGGLIGYFATTAYNSIKNVYRAAAKQQDDGVVSLQEATQSSEGDTQELGDITPDKSAPTVATGMDYDTLLDIMSDWTDTFKDGAKKAVAEIIYEFAAEGVIEPTNKEIWNEYKNRGFDNAVTQGRVESVIPSVKASREAYFKSRNVTLNQAAESVEVPADILVTMNELGYADVGSLIADLRSAVGRAQFIKDYVNQKHAEYRSAFLDNPEWSSESGATRYLDALLSALKVTSGIKFSERVKIARAEAERELKASGTVRDIVKGERGVAKSLSSNAAAILKALKADEGDKAAAVTAALDMHRNAARLQAIRTLRAEIQKLTKRAQRIGKSKPGSTLDGDTINAVKSLLFRFRLSGALPQWTTGPNDPQSVLDVMKEFTPDIDAELKKWSPWMQRVLTGEEAPTSWENLTPDQFYELTDLIDYLRGEGRDSLAEQKGTFANAFVEAMDAILPSVEAHKTGDYTDTEDKTMLQKLGSLARSGIHQMKTLVFMAHLLDGRTEFYGDHVIGPVRKFFQLPLSEGASRELYWYQKVSGEVKPHILALMRSAKERKLIFPVNNEETRRRAYPDLHGEQAAFVLLNAGATENRARLMESFGWSEDELDGILRQFTKEDFEHAEAIWKALREMGTELAKVYFEERHYRMKWAELTPISMTLNDGSTILSEGGYYPLAYRYHDSSRGFDPDIMNPFTRTFRPTRPTATFERSSNLTDLSLLMSPSVIEQSIRENAHYIGMWQPLRMANAIWTNKDFKQAVIHNFGKETYDALKQLMDNVNNPDKGETGLWKKAAQKLGACLATAALGFKITTMAKQYASLTIGAERLGGYFSDAVSYALHDLRGLRREVSNLSPFMRDRYNLMDRDLKVVNTEFKKPLAKAADKYRYAAFWGLKQNDLNVAAVQWYAAYNWALDPARGMTKDQARAYADDFVATTQGAARTIDTPVVQLETLGRLLTPFFGPACAAANTRIAGLSVLKDMDAGERIAFAIDNFMVPGLVMALVAAVRSGLADPDDDDDWDRIRKQSLTALLTEPISGVPVVQDIADATVRAAVTGKPVRSGIFEVSLFRPAEQASRDFISLMENWNNLGYSLYVGASLTGQLLEMPVVQVYEEYEKMYQWNFGDEDSKSLKKQLKGEKRK